MSKTTYSRTYRVSIPTKDYHQFGFLLSGAFVPTSPILTIISTELKNARITICTFTISLPLEDCVVVVKELRGSRVSNRSRMFMFLNHIAEDIELNALGIWPPTNIAA